ncbi:MAG: hypothetical protein RLZ25_1951 [Pseudomonadota bacterium]|jgi:methylated-DNA-[protein]-cysteine S-methyltransferase
MAAECELLATPFGRVELWVQHGHVCRIVLSPEPVSSQRAPTAALALRECNPLKGQIERYLQDPKQAFDWEIPADGTTFQHHVWDALKSIPSGEVRTYGELARALGSGARAVAAACRANRWPLLIPCHRVISATGEGGFCGHTTGPYLAIKRWLLAHEGRC